MFLKAVDEMRKADANTVYMPFNKDFTNVSHETIKPKKANGKQSINEKQIKSNVSNSRFELKNGKEKHNDGAVTIEFDVHYKKQ